MKGIKSILFVLVLLMLVPYVEAAPGNRVAIPEGRNFQKFQEEVMALQEKVGRGEISMMGAQKLQKKIEEKYDINMEGADSLDPALLEGLDMSQGTSPMTPIGVIPYTASVSEKWNRAIAEIHGKSFPEMIFHVPSWVGISEKWWQNHSPAIHSRAVLYPVLAKVFSNPSSYLISGWDSSMINSILMVSPDAAASAPLYDNLRAKPLGQLFHFSYLTRI